MQTLQLPNGALQLDVPKQLAAALICLPISYADYFPLALFSAAEKAQQAQMLKQVDKQRLRAAHGLKRYILSQFAGCPPEKLQFCFNPYGKPELICDGILPVYFNLSHGGDWVLLGVSTRAPLGVDIEKIRPITIGEIAAHLQHPQDLKISNITELYRLWVLKEASVKALGVGLQQDLTGFYVRSTNTNEYQIHLPPKRILKGYCQALDDTTLWALVS